MIDATELKVGSYYFYVEYYDNDLKVPDIETLAFLGKNLLESGENNYWYFQDPQMFICDNENPCINSSTKGVFRIKEEDMELLFDTKGLIELLKNCS